MNKQASKKIVDKNHGEGFDAKVLNGFPVKVVIENVSLEYREVELKLYDRKGYRAKWLECKLGKGDWEELVDQALNIYIENRQLEKVDALVHKHYGI